MIKEVLMSLAIHPALLSFFGSFFLGGETILILSILAGHGIFNFLVIWIFCMLGMWCADLTWFLIGKIKAFSRLKKIKFVHSGYKKARVEIESAPNNLFLLVLIKFAYGIGIPILMYLGRKKMRLKEFLIKNTLVIFTWATSIVILGWILGKTSAIALGKFESVYASIGLIITGIILINIIARYIEKRLIKAEKNYKK